MEAGMSPVGGAPDETQATRTLSDETWVCPLCTVVNPFGAPRFRKSGNLTLQSMHAGHMGSS